VGVALLFAFGSLGFAGRQRLVVLTLQVLHVQEDQPAGCESQR